MQDDDEIQFRRVPAHSNYWQKRLSSAMTKCDWWLSAGSRI